MTAANLPVFLPNILCRFMSVCQRAQVKKSYCRFNHQMAERARRNLLVLSPRFYSGLSPGEVKKRTEEISDSFSEARELLDDARESQDTVYFSDDMAEATEAVNQTLKMYEDFLSELSDEQKSDVNRTIGLKMSELKAQLSAIEESLKE